MTCLDLQQNVVKSTSNGVLWFPSKMFRAKFNPNRIFFFSQSVESRTISDDSRLFPLNMRWQVEGIFFGFWREEQANWALWFVLSSSSLRRVCLFWYAESLSNQAEEKHFRHQLVYIIKPKIKIHLEIAAKSEMCKIVEHMKNRFVYQRLWVPRCLRQMLFNRFSASINRTYLQFSRIRQM